MRSRWCHASHPHCQYLPRPHVPCTALTRDFSEKSLVIAFRAGSRVVLKPSRSEPCPHLVALRLATGGTVMTGVEPQRPTTSPVRASRDAARSHSRIRAEAPTSRTFFSRSYLRKPHRINRTQIRGALNARSLDDDARRRTQRPLSVSGPRRDGKHVLADPSPLGALRPPAPDATGRGSFFGFASAPGPGRDYSAARVPPSLREPGRAPLPCDMIPGSPVRGVRVRRAKGLLACLRASFLCSNGERDAASRLSPVRVISHVLVKPKRQRRLSVWRPSTRCAGYSPRSAASAFGTVSLGETL
jgi:hypothetical protein